MVCSLWLLVPRWCVPGGGSKNYPKSDFDWFGSCFYFNVLFVLVWGFLFAYVVPLFLSFRFSKRFTVIGSGISMWY